VGASTAPVAALQLKLTWKISTPLKSDSGTNIYFMQGDGIFEEIASPFAHIAADARTERLKRLPLFTVSPDSFFGPLKTAPQN
jgi:hypothetical protein